MFYVTASLCVSTSVPLTTYEHSGLWAASCFLTPMFRTPVLIWWHQHHQKNLQILRHIVLELPKFIQVPISGYLLRFRLHFVPHNFVWGSCFWFCIPGAPPPPAARLSHTTLCQPSLSTNIFHTHLCQPSLSTTIFHTPSFTHHLSHTIFHTPSLSTIFVNHLSHTIFHHLSQAWHLATSTFVLRGRRATYGTGLGLVARLDRIGREVTPRHFAWQAWHSATSTCHLRRGTWRHPPSFHVAGVALGNIHRRFAWQACHLWHWAGSIVARLDRIGRTVTPRHLAWQVWHPATSTCHLRGRRGTWRHPSAICVAGVALETLGRVWWRAWTGLVARWRRGTLRGRCGTRRHPPAICVAGVALGDIHLPFAWQVWHLETSNGVALCHTPSLTHPLSRLFHTPSLSHTIFHTPSFTPNFATHHLWHTIFHTPLCHPSFLTHHLFTHNFVTHHPWPSTLSHTIFHTPLCHPPSLTRHLSHTALSHTIFDTQLCHAPSFTPLCHTPSFTHHLSHNFVTPSLTHDFVTHHLSHTIFDIPPFTHTIVVQHHFWRTTLSHSIFYTQLFHTPSLTHHLSHTTLSHTTLNHSIFRTPLWRTPSFIFHTQLCRTPTLSDVRFYRQLSHTHNLSQQCCHTQHCFTSRSSTTSFVFPSFPVPATTFGVHYWKKLPCGVIRSFNFYSDNHPGVFENGAGPPIWCSFLLWVFHVFPTFSGTKDILWVRLPPAPRQPMTRWSWPTSDGPTCCKRLRRGDCSVEESRTEGLYDGIVNIDYFIVNDLLILCLWWLW